MLRSTILIASKAMIRWFELIEGASDDNKEPPPPPPTDHYKGQVPVRRTS